MSDVILTMSDELLTTIAVSVDLGVLLVLATLFFHVPRLRKKVVVVLGALTPILAFYGAIIVAFALDPHDVSNGFSFYAGWVMTFEAFLESLAVGVFLAFVPRPINLFGRYLVGCAIPGLASVY